MENEAKITCTFCGKSPDISKEIIFRSKFKENVFICEHCIKSSKARIDEIKSDKDNSCGSDEEYLLLTPLDIRNYLDKYVVGQKHAKNVLSVALYKHMQLLAHAGENSEVEVEKSNIIIVGPTGSGKTHIVKSLARLFKVPYAIADATTLTESGYVGADVETVLQKLIVNAGGNVKEAERGIVFIDEIDKKANKGQVNNSITRDVSGEGVQQALLKLIEGSVVDVQMNGDRRHPYSETVPIDTSKILFIVGGAFPGLEEIIKKRLNYKRSASVGINLSGEEEKLSKSALYNEVIDSVTTEDFRSYGLIPEFLGRLPIICPLKELTEDELVQILTEPKNALVKQYKQQLGYDDVDLVIDDDALKAIAHKAIENKTGARGLRAIMEDLLLEPMLVVPDEMREADRRGILEVTAECVTDNKKPSFSLCA